MPELNAADREEFLRHFPVSHETLSRLDRYAELLIEWNERFNLVAESTLPHIWKRHFLDSAQLLNFLPNKNLRLADLGSGAGFPGLVLNIMGVSNIHLVESIGKKAEFLKHVIEELNLTAIVHHARIEALGNLAFDAITARALKPLPQLLNLCKPLIKKDSFLFFLKGQQAEVELTEAAKYWKFDIEIVPSVSDHSGRVLKITNPQSKGRNANAARAKSSRK